MQERNIINGTTTASVSSLLDFYEKLIPFLLLAIDYPVGQYPHDKNVIFNS